MKTFHFVTLLLAATSLCATPAPSSGQDVPLVLHLQEFPNPFSDHIMITMPDGLVGNTEAEICDEAGRPVLTWPLGFPEGAGAIVTLDTPDLPAGVYVLRLMDERGDQGEATVYCE